MVIEDMSQGVVGVRYYVGRPDGGRSGPEARALSFLRVWSAISPPWSLGQSRLTNPIIESNQQKASRLVANTISPEHNPAALTRLTHFTRTQWHHAQ